MKNKLKLLLFILIVPFMCINVNAQEITQEEYMNIFANNVPTQVTLDETFAYYLSDPSDRETQMQQEANSILTNMNAYMTANDLEYTFDSVEISYSSDNPDYTRFVCTLKVNGTTVRLIYGDVYYKDHENYSEEDNALVNTLFNDTTVAYSYDISSDERDILYSQNLLLARNPFYTEIDELLAGTGVTYIASNLSYNHYDAVSAGVYGTIYVFKNDVYYKTVYISKLWTVLIDVPNDVEKTIDDYTDYAEDVVKHVMILPPESQIDLEQALPGYGYPSYRYEIIEDNMYCGVVPIVNGDKVLLADYFQVDKTTADELVYARTITSTDNTENYENMVSYLAENGYSTILNSYYVTGNNTRKAYFYFDNALNGKAIRILGIKNNEYQSIDATIENGLVTADIYMNQEVIIALKDEEQQTEQTPTVTFNDIENKISGYYSSSYSENEINNIKNEIENTIRQEIKDAGINFEEEGYTVSVENNNGWVVKITNNKNQTHTVNIYITPKTVVEQTTNDQVQNNNTQRNQTVRRTTVVNRVNNTYNEEKEKQEETNSIEETQKVEKEEKTKEIEPIKEKDTTKEVKEDTKPTKEVNTLPIKIIIGSVILLIVGGIVIYLRSRYY